ncbi:MAG TPA: penicillin-binding protein 2 [Solirubrobacteraceae bacterium]|nr:penicillin-binding protein 2 [Solirubrobacteraceae bacterium]
MNAPITRLYVVVIVLFAVLIGFTSNWTVFGAESLRDNPKNRRELLEQQRIRRGVIRADDGSLLARSVRRPDDTFTRTYPQDRLFAHAIGYSFTRFGRAGLEQSRNDALSGTTNELGTIFDRLSGGEPEGEDVRTTLDPSAQRAAIQALNGRKGAVVALDPQTGAIKVMASIPDYDPNDLAQPGAFTRLNRDQDAPLLNRATQSGYPPGSTFKVVTAIAATDSGEYTPGSTVSGRNLKPISGVPLRNFGNENFGQITLTDALTHSVNTAWAEVGEKLGKRTMGEYMDRLGFNDQVRVDLPPDERRASGEFQNGRLLKPTSRAVDVGRMAIGQDKLNVTPLQMAMVPAAVANGGRLMEPHLTDRIVDRDGRTVDRIQPREMSRVMSAQAAGEVADMMGRVVEEGTGTAAALEGVSVGGKTGTAEVDRPCGPNQAWFIAFAPRHDPKVAIAATVECTSGTGGDTAAPIAKQVMQELLR